MPEQHLQAIGRERGQAAASVVHRRRYESVYLVTRGNCVTSFCIALSHLLISRGTHRRWTETY